MHVLLSPAKNSTALIIRICDPKFIPKIKIGSKRIDKSLYSIPADYKSAGTLALLIHISCTWNTT